ncbi:hypothetical protein, unlikely [Trypanosoma brucei gambiense DAL972]|uniref:Uncharacterized protein n=1 Tax=Trypanosoma brucei gambiense (strain MHOM/CI/86/DAL972) TaxID=679716 RepID=C9ZWS9_TRYB9|nr:hypothetical protein, unlikely [Trypanosoma brucei gambiense DAL972]CBH13868.1 hypothetical protein, unlikely [Trypanosoma brucei gambiense DAL972]|eukprot:XP_011776144.1 hypothetical protein, unlikely [Trypanosoma brucei gambiense DAL972]
MTLSGSSARGGFLIPVHSMVGNHFACRTKSRLCFISLLYSTHSTGVALLVLDCAYLHHTLPGNSGLLLMLCDAGSLPRCFPTPCFDLIASEVMEVAARVSISVHAGAMKGVFLSTDPHAMLPRAMCNPILSPILKKDTGVHAGKGKTLWFVA